MKRRTLLAVLAAASSTGCLGSAASGDPSRPNRSPTGTATPTDAATATGTPTPTDETTPSSTPTPQQCSGVEPRAVTVAATADLPADLDLTMRATMERTRLTAGAPPRVRVRLANEGERRDVFPNPGEQCDPFNRSKGGSDPEGLWLYEPPEAPDANRETCWSAPRPEVFLTYGCGTTEFAPGEERAWTYELWDDARVEGYYPPGRCRFATEVRVESDGSGEGKAVPWWLDLQVARPTG